MQLASALGHQRQWGGRLGSVLVQMGLVDEQAICEAVSRQLAIPSVRLAGCEIPHEVLGLVPRELCEKHQLLPWSRTRNERGAETIHVAMSDPTNLAVVDELAFRTGKRLEVAVASDRDIELAIRHHFHGERWSDSLRPAAAAPAVFRGPELDLQAGDEAPLEVAENARARVERSLVVELDDDLVIDEVRVPEKTPAAPHLVYGGAAPAQATPLSLRERLLLQTLEAELGAEGLPDRQLLLALARLLIRKGVIGEDEWIAEIARR